LSLNKKALLIKLLINKLINNALSKKPAASATGFSK